jgi:hypothetical protein
MTFSFFFGSRSGKTRSLFELLCRTFGIYFSLDAGNGSRNLGSQDMDISIRDLGQYLTANYPVKNTLIALKFTRAMLLGRLFILNKLLDFYNQDVNRNFTPKQWLLMQLLPTRITELEDFWTTISRIFRKLKLEDQDELINTFTAKFKTLTSQEKLPIVIDESQIAINTYKEIFSSPQTEGQLRPFFSILLRAVLELTTWNFLCLVLSGTGMSFDDINIYSASAIAKSGGITYKDFFSIHDGFYECNEMSKFIRRFLPLNDELIRATFNIFQGRRRFIVQFLENAILDKSSMSQTDVNKIVKNWQNKAIEFIIETFMKSCFPFLCKKKHAWDKVKDIAILSLFSHYTKLVRGSGVSEMVQYGFAQLCELKGLADLNTLKKDAITVRIAEPIPILAFREYIKENPDEFETQLYRNLCSVHYNASCAGFLFEPCLTIPLAELFNSKSCKEHVLFTGIKDIDKLDSLLSCKVTIRNFDDRNLSIFSSNGTMKKGFNLPAFLNNPTTAFFMPEKEAGPDLVCIVEFHTPDGIIEIPVFLQAKLVKDPPKGSPEGTTDPNHFYPHGEKRSKSKEELKNEVLDCLKSKYCKAHELSWIRFLVVFPAEAKAESQYIIDRPRRTVDSYYNYSQGIESPLLKFLIICRS